MSKDRIEELNDPSKWVYYNEGNNNIIFRYVGKDSWLAAKILRIRKNNNQEYYTDPTLYPLDEYNDLFVQKVFMQHPVLSQYLQEFEYVNLERSFLEAIDLKIQQESEGRN